MYEYNKPLPLKIHLRRGENCLEVIDTDTDHLPEPFVLDEFQQLKAGEQAISASHWTPIDEETNVKVEIVYKAGRLDWMSKRKFFSTFVNFFRKKCATCGYFDHKAGFKFLNEPTHVFDDKTERNMHVDYANIIATQLCIRGIDPKNTGVCKRYNILVPTSLPSCEKWIR